MMHSGERKSIWIGLVNVRTFKEGSMLPHSFGKRRLDYMLVSEEDRTEIRS
jgi:hypothetical protein